MTTAFVFADSAFMADDNTQTLIEPFKETMGLRGTEHVVIFPVANANEDLQEFYDDVAAFATEHGEAHVYFLHIENVQLRIINELLALPVQIVLH